MSTCLSDTRPSPSSCVLSFAPAHLSPFLLSHQIIFIIMLGQATPHFSTGLGGVGEAEAASVLSFGAAVAGFSLGWTSLAADYTVNLPADTSDWKVFI